MKIMAAISLALSLCACATNEGSYYTSGAYNSAVGQSHYQGRQKCYDCGQYRTDGNPNQ